MAQELLEVPNPPDTPESKGYYYVYGEWTRTLEGRKVATANNPNPPGVVRQTIQMNEAISMHPAIFTELIQEQRPGYAVKAWSPISKALYDWCIEVQRRKNQAIRAAMAKEGSLIG